MKKAILVSSCIMLLTSQLPGQTKPDTASVRPKAWMQIQSGITSNDVVPFWFRSNQFGSIPVNGASMSFLAGVEKGYSGEKKLFDWGYGIEARSNLGRDQHVRLIEAYTKVRFGAIQLKVGRSKDLTGLVDSTLSTGSYALSGNAIGIPKVQLSLPDFLPIPGTNYLLAIKGSFSHGWMGELPIQYTKSSVKNANSYFHESSFFLKLGKPNWKVNLYGGINHEVVWGGDKLIFQDQYNLNGIEALYHVITGKKYKGVADISKIGNHLGSIDLGAKFDLHKVDLMFYRQHFYDKGAIAYLANFMDGLNGISLVNKGSVNGSHWKKILFEVFYSKNQAGEEGSKRTPSGPEYYYNHAVYSTGYSYKGFGLGSPLITPARYARSGLPNDPLNYFINNRVLAFHTGVEGIFRGFTYQAKLTYSSNWGEYRTSNVGYWFNGKRYERVSEHGIFEKVNQFSSFLEVNRELKRGVSVGVASAVDQGRLFNNSVGGFLTLKKKWN